MYEIFQGDDDIFNVIVKDENGDLVDISDIDLLFSVKDRDSYAILFSKSSNPTNTDRLEKDDPTNGHAKIYINGSDTESLLGAYQFDIQLTLANGMVKTFVKDILMVKGDISAP